MKVIYKQQLAFMNSQAVLIPEDAEILSIQIQNGTLCFWYMCDQYSSVKKERYFHIYGTGMTVLPDNGNETFLETVQAEDGHVWHVYESPIY